MDFRAQIFFAFEGGFFGTSTCTQTGFTSGGGLFGTSTWTQIGFTIFFDLKNQ